MELMPVRSSTPAGDRLHIGAAGSRPDRWSWLGDAVDLLHARAEGASLKRVTSGLDVDPDGCPRREDDAAGLIDGVTPECCELASNSC